MLCFFNLPYKGAKGQSQRQCRELARTSGQIARLAYRGGEHTPSSLEPSCRPPLLFLPALPPSRPLPHRVLASVDTACLAGTPAQHIQGEPSQISLCYFKPTKDAGPLPHSLKYLSPHPRPRLWGHFPTLTNPPQNRVSQQGVQGGTSSILLLWGTGLRKPAQLSWEYTMAKLKGTSGHQSRETEASREDSLRSRDSMSISLLKFFTGAHREAWGLEQQSTNLLKSCTKSPL